VDSGQLALGALSFLAAFANGVLGAGNAIIFIPMALYALPLAGVRLEAHAVAALSLVVGVSTVAVGMPLHARRGHLEYRQVWLGGPALGAGGLAGGLVSAAAPAWLLVLLFAVVATVAAVLLLLPPPGRERAAPPSPARQIVVLLLLAGIGGLGGAIGVGAGVLVIPVLLYVLGTAARRANGTGLVLPAFISAPAFVGKALTGQVPWSLVPAVAVAAVAGTAAGAVVTVGISPAALRRGLSGLTAALALTVWAQLLLPLTRG
jgi:uncharacterized membrane protein YfcA